MSRIRSGTKTGAKSAHFGTAPGSGAPGRVDGALRQWPVAGLSLLTLAVLFGLAMQANR